MAATTESSNEQDGIGVGAGDSGWKILFQGAESRVYHGQYDGQQAIRKERFRKNYRHPELDTKLTRQRIRAEVNAYEKIKKKCPELDEKMPKVLKSDDRNIIMTKITQSINLSQYIERNGDKPENISSALKLVARIVAQLHDQCLLIHGDLTTSNFLVVINDQPDSPPTIIPIDFGLSYSSKSDEDRAVDLYVLERAIQSTHPGVDFDPFLQSYREEMGQEKGDKILKRLNLVRMRGRKRSMVG